MNKKGFTLVELLAVIVILALITIIAIPSSISISNNIKSSMYCNKLDIINRAANLYAKDYEDEIRLGTINSVDVSTLINEKYVKADKTVNGQKVVMDPRNDSFLNDYVYNLGINNNTVYAKPDNEDYRYLCVEDKIVDKVDPKCVFKGQSEVWTNKDRIIKVSCYDKESGCKYNETEYTFTKSAKTDSIPEESYFSNKYTIKDYAGNKSECTNIPLNVYVDKEVPSYEVVGESTTWAQSRTITIKCVDKLSGCKTKDIILEYGLYATDSNKLNKVTDTINIELEDNAGNKEPYNITFDVYVDTNPPVCSYKENTEWETSSGVAGLGIECNDNLTKDESGCSKKMIPIDIDTTQKEIAVTYAIQDRAGNETVCSKNLSVYIDNTKPVIEQSSVSGNEFKFKVKDESSLKKYEIYKKGDPTVIETKDITTPIFEDSYNKGNAGTYILKVYDGANNFVTKEFTINPVTASFVVVGNGTIVGNSVIENANYNESAEVEISPNIGYHFETVSCTNDQIATGNNNSINIDRLNKNTVCTITFVVDTYTISYSNGSSITRTQTCDYGSFCTLYGSLYTNNGHIQSKWVNGSTKYNLSEKVQDLGNLTLTPEWSACNTCAAGTGADCSLVVSNNTCTYNTSCKAGYNTISNDGKYNPSCKANSYTVTFKVTNGSKPGNKSLSYGGSQTFTSSPTSGYSYKSASCNNGASISRNGTTYTVSGVPNTVANGTTITCTISYTDQTKPSTPTGIVIHYPEVTSTKAGIFMRGQGSSDGVGIAKYQFKINNSWVDANASSIDHQLIWNSSTKSTTYTVSAVRAIDAAGNVSSELTVSRKLTVKRAYIWQCYTFLRSSTNQIVTQPSETDINYWDSKTKAAEIAVGIMASETEAQNNYKSAGASAYASRLYQGILGRTADSGGQAYVAGLGLQNGAKFLANSDEAQAIYSAWGIGTGTI